MQIKKLLLFFYLLNYSRCKTHNTISIVSNNAICTNIGKAIFLKQGTIIDASIAIMLCEGIIDPQDSGIGGGFYGIFKLNKKIFIVNAREITPQKINHADIISKYLCNIGIPSSLKGYELLHNKYGKLPWKSLFVPIIKLCYKGFIADNNLKFAIDITNFHDIINKQMNNGTYFIKNNNLCKTLTQIAHYGASYFYNVLSKKIIKELSPWNKYLTHNDFITYKPKISKPSCGSIHNLKIYSSSYPAPGKVIIESFKKMLSQRDPNLLLILKDFYKNAILEQYNQYQYAKKNITSYGNRHGTSNICIKENDNIVCITSTINTYFGSKFHSKSTGIILNNQLNDIPGFYTIIPPKTIPPTSISTTLIFKKNKFYMGLGGTGGNRIPAGILNVLYYHFIQKYSFEESIHMNRFFNIIVPEYEDCVFNSILCKKFNKFLKKLSKEHHISFSISKSSYNTVTGIYKLKAVSDPRRGGLGITFKI